MVFYAVLAAVQLREQPRQKLSERAPKSGAILRRRRRVFPESVLALLSRRRREVSRFRNPHFSIDQHWSGAAPIRENTHREPCAATSGITNFSRLPAAQSFAAPNLNTLHFTPLTGGPQRKHERPADRSRPKAGQRQRSRALAVAGARRRPGAPRQRGRLPVPARADQATDARAVLLRRPLSSPATVLLLLRVRSASASGVGTKQERSTKAQSGERYRRDVAPARHLTGRRHAGRGSSTSSSRGAGRSRTGRGGPSRRIYAAPRSRRPRRRCRRRPRRPSCSRAGRSTAGGASSSSSATCRSGAASSCVPASAGPSRVSELATQVCPGVDHGRIAFFVAFWERRGSGVDLAPLSARW